MLINRDNNVIHKPVTFKARVPLKDMSALVKSTSSETPLDVLLYSNRPIRFIEQISLYLKRSVDNKYFQKRGSWISEGFHKVVNSTIMQLRKAALNIFVRINKKELNTLYNTFMKFNPNSSEYIEEIAKIGNSLKGKYIVTNTGNNPLELLAKTNDSTIFVLNHPNYHKDKCTYAIINAILNKMYVAQGRQADCPRPKIIVSRNLLKTIGEKLGEIYKKMGMVTIDASLNGRNVAYNATVMRNLVLDFVNNKINTFIFPEGLNSSKEIPFEKRLQHGIASFITKSLHLKDKIRVVPVGIKYTSDADNFGNIFIGKPIYIKKSDNKLIYTHGTEIKEIAIEDFNAAPAVIFDEICKNMQYCMDRAQNLK